MPVPPQDPYFLFFFFGNARPWGPGVDAMSVCPACASTILLPYYYGTTAVLPQYFHGTTTTLLQNYHDKYYSTITVPPESLSRQCIVSLLSLPL